MLRTNVDSREIRKGYFVFVSNCAIHAQKAWRSQRHVSAVSYVHPRNNCGCGEKQSGLETLHRRCATCSFEVLGALFGFYQVCDKTPAGNITDVDCRSWWNVGYLDKIQKSTRAVWIKTVVFSLAVTGTTGLIPVLVALTGTTLLRIRTTTSGLVSSVTTFINALPMSRLGRLTNLHVVSQRCPASANTFQGSV